MFYQLILFMIFCQGRQQSHTITTITNKYDTQKMVQEVNFPDVRYFQIWVQIDLVGYLFLEWTDFSQFGLIIETSNWYKILFKKNAWNNYNFSKKSWQYYCSKWTEVLNVIIKDKTTSLIWSIRSLKQVESSWTMSQQGSLREIQLLKTNWTNYIARHGYIFSN